MKAVKNLEIVRNVKCKISADLVTILTSPQSLPVYCEVTVILSRLMRKC